jgi:hypothetical protein
MISLISAPVPSGAVTMNSVKKAPPSKVHRPALWWFALAFGTDGEYVEPDPQFLAGKLVVLTVQLEQAGHRPARRHICL